MSNSKYVKNRNLWRRVYPRTRQKPRLLQIVEATGVSASIDLSRQVRSRDFFQYDDPVSGSLVLPPLPTTLLPQDCFVYPSGSATWITKADGSLYVLTGSTVGVWRTINTENQDTAEIDFGEPMRQTTVGSQPLDELRSTGSFADIPVVTFDGTNDYMVHDVRQYVDFMHRSGSGFETGGTAISVVSIPGDENVSFDKKVWNNENGIFSRGSYLQLRYFGASSPSTFYFRFVQTNGGVSVFRDSQAFRCPPEEKFVTAIVRFDAAAKSMNVRVQGFNGGTTTNNFLGNLTSNLFLHLGSSNGGGSQNFSGSIYFQSFLERVLTDEECECIENWADSVFGLSGSVTKYP